MEFFAEWSLCPENVAFLRVQTGESDWTMVADGSEHLIDALLGVYDPGLIGDKPKWYSNDLTGIAFKIIEDSSTLGQAVNSFQVKSNESEYTPTGKSMIGSFCSSTTGILW